jgi:hypothetical protein
LAPEPRRGAGVVAVLVILAALGAAVSLTEFFVAPSYRQTAIRLFSALILLVAVARVRAIVLASVERRAAWGEGALGEAWPARRDADSRLARFRDEIRFSVRSQSYFEHLLWPRLVALARARRAGAPEALAKPPGRRFGLGPSLVALTRLIASLETRR